MEPSSFSDPHPVIPGFCAAASFINANGTVEGRKCQVTSVEVSIRAPKSHYGSLSELCTQASQTNDHAVLPPRWRSNTIWVSAPAFKMTETGKRRQRVRGRTRSGVRKKSKQSHEGSKIIRRRGEEEKERERESLVLKR